MASRETSNEAPDDQQAPTRIVCVYNQFDQQWYNDLKTYLILWERASKITWLDIQAGADTAQTMETYLQRADLILLLLSPTFFASHPCYNAMLLALQEQEQRPIPVVPIITRACDWKASACGGLKALPENALPLAQWTHPEQAYGQIRVGLVRLLPGFSADGQPDRPRLFQARDLPRGYVPRRKAFDEIKHLLLHRQGNKTTAITTALRGAGGFGKTTLALALCHDSEIQAAFPDGILWIELGEQPPRPLDVLNGVLASLDRSLSGAITFEEARGHWRTALEERTCLLVIDDVWQIGALEPLLEGGPQCMRLVTTRNDQVLPEETAKVWVDEMEPEEAIAVLCRSLPDEVQQAAYQPRLETLAKRLGYWPLLLTLAHGMLTSFVKRGQHIGKALTAIEKAYQTRGITAFHQEHADERQQTANACLGVSLRHLKKITPPHYDATARYHELAVFPEDTNIPLTTLHTYWQRTGGLEDYETEDLCVCLDDLSLILPADFGKGMIRLHDVFRSYLIQHVGPHLPELHERLLDAYQQVLGLICWADLPQSDSYLWHHLIFHLCQAGRREALQETLTDLNYLIHKALYVGVSAFESDFLLASTVFPTESSESEPSFFTFLHRRIVRISHLLRQVQTEAEMGSLLLSHLAGEAAFAEQRQALERNLPRPFLTFWRPLQGGTSSALLRILRGHTKSVTSCAVSSDGRFLVSASQDDTLKVWNVASGASYSLIGHAGWVTSCAVSPDGRFLVSGSADRTLKVWDATTGTERFSLIGHTGWVTNCAVSPNGHFIVSASHDRTLKVWDAITGAKHLSLKGHTGWVTSCAVSPDGHFLVSASQDGTLKVWDAATGTKRLSLKGHTREVNDCAVSPDGRFLVSASEDRTLKVWDAATGAERFSLRDNIMLTSCVVSPDGRFIVSASQDGTLKMWNATAGAEPLFPIGHTGWVTSCVVSPDGHFIVSGSVDHTLSVWDVTTGAMRLSLIGHTREVNDCAVSPDSHFIVSASQDGTLKMWNATTGVERFSLIGLNIMLNGCAVSPDGHFIISTSHDSTLKVWNVAGGTERFSLKGHTGWVTSCAVSPDGHFIVSGSSDCTLKVWDATTGTKRLSLIGHTREVTSCTVSPDNRFIVSGSADRTLKVWDATTGAKRISLKGHTKMVNDCAVSPDGRFIVSVSSDHTLKVWEMRTGCCVLTFPVDGELGGCAFHPDGERLVACGAMGMYFLRLVVSSES